MALLTLIRESDRVGWPTITTKLAALTPTPEPLQEKDRRTRCYRLNLRHDPDIITTLQKTKGLLAAEPVSFFVDIEP